MSQLQCNSIVPLGGLPAGASGGGIIQCVQVVKTDSFSTSTNANGGVAVTGLSASITPRSTSNKILIMVSMTLSSNSPGYNAAMSLYRGATLIGAGDRTSDTSTPLQQRVAAFQYIYGSNVGTTPISTLHLDSPATTSSVTYSVNIHNDGRGTTVVVGNTDTSNNTYVQKPVAQITLMEVSG